MCLLKGVSSDVSCLSKMCLYVSDPADSSNPPLKQTKKTLLKMREKWNLKVAFFRQLSTMLLVEVQNLSLISTNAFHIISSFFSQIMTCCSAWRPSKTGNLSSTALPRTQTFRFVMLSKGSKLPLLV